MKRMPHRALRAGAALLVFFAAGAHDAFAQSGGNQAVAEALFQEAWKLMDAGKVGDACPKFAESNRIDPKLGTLVALATCHERDGKTATAWAEFTKAVGVATAAGNEKRATYARDHAQALEKKLSRVVIDVDDKAQSPTVQLDGTEVGAPAWGTPVPLDPGEHEVSASAPGKAAWSGHVTLPPGPATVHLRVPSLAAAAVAAAPAKLPAEIDASSSHPSGSGTGLKIAGFTLVGAGAVGLVVGSIFGVQTFSQKSAGLKHCTGSACDPEGVKIIGQAHDSATVSTIAFAAGAALAAGGVAVLLVSRSKSATSTGQRVWLTPTAARDGGGLFVGGDL
jgi:hypothetical protein